MSFRCDTCNLQFYSTTGLIVHNEKAHKIIKKDSRVLDSFSSHTKHDDAGPKNNLDLW
jgi:hypothetical protein